MVEFLGLLDLHAHEVLLHPLGDLRRPVAPVRAAALFRFANCGAQAGERLELAGIDLRANGAPNPRDVGTHRARHAILRLLLGVGPSRARVPSVRLVSCMHEFVELLFGQVSFLFDDPEHLRCGGLKLVLPFSDCLKGSR